MKKNISLRNCDLTLLKNNNLETILSLFLKELNFRSTLFFIGILFVSNYGNAQQVQKIHFDYDTAGNQITREFCLTCLAKTSNSTKNISDLVESDMQKFKIDDNFSFYPNPVKEELYLKWDNSSQIKVQTIKLYNINGALLKSYENQLSKDSNNILLQVYPNGVYIIGLIYTNGDEKTIKIIKQ